MLFGLELLFSCEKNDILDTVKDIGVAYPVSFRLLEKIFRVCNDRKEENNMNGEEVKSTSKEYVLQSWNKQKGLNPIPIAKAEGIYLYDFDGKRYTDMSSQLVNMNLGFGNKDIADAIKEQVDKYCYVSPAYGSEPRATLAKMIIDLLPDNFGKIFFTNAGADANENAIKIARMYTGRKKIFSRACARALM